MNNEEWCKKNCPYYPDCSGGGACNYVLALLKEQEQKIKELESMRVSASGNAVAIGVVRGGLKITR